MYKVYVNGKDKGILSDLISCYEYIEETYSVDADDWDFYGITFPNGDAEFDNHKGLKIEIVKSF